MKTVDVGAVLDEGRWTGYQKLLIFGTALTIVLDGVDNQLLPNSDSDPDQGVGQHPRPRSCNALASGPFGMMIGGLIGGVIGDRLGRRDGAPWQRASRSRVLTLAIAFVQLDRHRCSACCGSWPAWAWAARCPTRRRWRPSTCRARQRPFAVTLTIVCIPLGGVRGRRTRGAHHSRLRLALAVPGRRRRAARPRRDSVEGAARVAALPGAAPRALARADAAAHAHRPRRAGRRRVRRGGGARRAAGAEGVDRRPVRAALRARHRRPVGVVLLLPDGQLRGHSAGAGHADRRRRVHAAGGQPRPDDGRTSAASSAPSLGALLIQRLGSRITMLGMSAIAIVACAMSWRACRSIPPTRSR